MQMFSDSHSSCPETLTSHRHPHRLGIPWRHLAPCTIPRLRNFLLRSETLFLSN